MNSIAQLFGAPASFSRVRTLFDATKDSGASAIITLQKAQSLSSPAGASATQRAAAFIAEIVGARRVSKAMETSVAARAFYDRHGSLSINPLPSGAADKPQGYAVDLYADWHGFLRTGGGDDIVTMSTRYGAGGGTVRTGDGDDVIAMSVGLGDVSGGAGDDVIILQATHAAGDYDGFEADYAKILTEQDTRFHSNASGGAGNDVISIVALDGASANGGTGNDKITISAVESRAVYGGAGDDTIAVSTVDAKIVNGGDGEDVINVAATGTIWAVDGGSGDDLISLSATGDISVVHGGEGNNTIAIAGNNVIAPSAGSGDDVINVAAGHVAMAIYAGRGSNVVNVAAGDEVRSIETGQDDDVINVAAGGAVKFIDSDLTHADFDPAEGGEDVIAITADTAAMIYSGAGDDHVIINARRAENIDGGAGNDTITLAGTEHASLTFDKGDGHDMVRIAGETVLNFRGRSAEDAIVTYGSGTMTISFKGSEDTVTIDYTQASLAEAEPALSFSDVSAADFRDAEAEDFLQQRLYFQGTGVQYREWSDLFESQEGGFQIRIS